MTTDLPPAIRGLAEATGIKIQETNLQNIGYWVKGRWNLLPGQDGTLRNEYVGLVLCWLSKEKDIHIYGHTLGCPQSDGSNFHIEISTYLEADKHGSRTAEQCGNGDTLNAALAAAVKTWWEAQ